MPIPRGAHQVPGQKNRIQLSDGTIVTRARARTLGAQERGATSDRAYSKSGQGEKDAKYVDAFRNSTQGRLAEERERELARAEGRRFNKAQFEQRVIAARNARPHPRSGTEAGEAYVDFMTRYEITGGADWVAY